MFKHTVIYLDGTHRTNITENLCKTKITYSRCSCLLVITSINYETG